MSKIYKIMLAVTILVLWQVMASSIQSHNESVIDSSKCQQAAIFTDTGDLVPVLVDCHE